MSDIKNLKLPKFYNITMAEYQSIPVKDSFALYYIKGTSMAYKGNEPYGSSIKRVTELPTAANAIPELHYALTTGNDAGIYMLNAAKDGYICLAVSKAYVDNLAKDLLKDVEYDPETANLIFTRVNGTEKVINLTKDNFLSAASFDAETNILTLTLVDGATVEVPLTDLIDVYEGGETNTATVDVTDGEITVDVKVSEATNNIIEAKADGLYAKKTPIVVPSDTSTDDEAASAKAMYDTIASMAWVESV